MCKIPYKRYSQDSSKGFTLLELLIAMSLSALIMVVLVGGFAIITKNWEAQETILDDAIDDSLIFLELEKAIRGTFPYSYFEEKKETIFFLGDKEELKFISTMSPSYNNQLTLWYLKAIPDGGIYIHISSNFTGNPEETIQQLAAKDEQEATQVLTDYKVDFEYLYIQNTDKSEWNKSWNAEDKNMLPRAVKINLKKIDDDEPESDNRQIIATILAYEHDKIKAKKITH